MSDVTESLNVRLARIEARQEIADTVSRNSRAVDSRDRAAYAELWAADATHELGDPVVVHGGRDAILMAFDSTLAKFSSTHHITSNLVVGIANTLDRATSISDVVVHTIRADGQPLTVAASYHDDFVREDGRWQFSRRVVVGRDVAGREGSDPAGAVARDAIRTLCFRYTFALDEGDFDAVGGMLASGGLRPSMPGVVGELIIGADAIAAFYGEQVVTYKNGNPRTRHLVTNQVIDLDPELRTASAFSYFTVLQRATGHDYEIVVGGRYFDRFECVDGVWHFVEKTIQVDHLNRIERHFKIADALRG